MQKLIETYNTYKTWEYNLKLTNKFPRIGISIKKTLTANIYMYRYSYHHITFIKPLFTAASIIVAIFDLAAFSAFACKSHKTTVYLYVCRYVSMYAYMRKWVHLNRSL